MYMHVQYLIVCVCVCVCVCVPMRCDIFIIFATLESVPFFVPVLSNYINALQTQDYIYSW